MIKIYRETDCCGCSACANACTRNAIIMQRDKKGFLYPVVNADTCNNCGLCERICPIINEKEERTPQHVYALKNKNESVRLESSSGGIFSILAENVLRQRGVVYGAVFDKKWNVVHSRIESIEDLQKLRGSKYVQSSIGDSFRAVRDDLKSGRKVLFSGTPCQVAGLNAFLRKEYENLITVDFVCHGVPNPRIWEDYLKEEIAARRAVAGKSTDFSSLNAMSLIEDIKFRDKSNGWKKYRFSLRFADASAEGKKSSDFPPMINTYVWEHPYMLLFLKDYILRPSCHECHFRCGKSHATYTIGDYWGIERHYPEFFDDKGISLLLQYENKDISNILDSTIYIETKFNDACYGNTCIKYSWPKNKDAKYLYLLHDRLNLTLTKSLHILLCIKSVKDAFNSIIVFLKKTTKKVLTSIYLWPK